MKKIKKKIRNSKMPNKLNGQECDVLIISFTVRIISESKKNARLRRTFLDDHRSNNYL